MKFGSLPVIVFLFAATAELAHLQAQDDGPINAVWLEADLKGIALIPGILPLELHSIEELKRRLGGKVGIDEVDLGFGARRVSLRNGSVFTRL